MPQDEETLENTVKIVPLQSILKKKTSSGVNKNYLEFQSVYARYDDESQEKTQQRYNDVRPKTNVKTITMDLPSFGSERAILQPWKRPVLKSLKLKQTQVEVSQKVVPKLSIVQKLSELEKTLEQKPSLELKKTPSSFIERTNMELSIAAEQLAHIKNLIKAKETDKPKKPKTPKYKSKRNSHHHKDCLKKNYMTTLSTVQQKLQSLEDKYFARPKIIFRNVNDTFTQSTSVETIYESNTVQNDNEVDEKLKGIIQELDELATRDEETHRDYPPRDISLVEPVSIGDEDVQQYTARVKEVIFENDATDMMLVELDKETHAAVPKTDGRESPRYYPFDNYHSFNETRDEDTEGNSWYSYNRLSFKKPEPRLPKDALSRLIDTSESRLKQFRRTKQDIIDVEAICDKICGLSNEDESENQVNKSDVNATSFFDGSILQQNVSKSCYLTKEFGAVKVFTEDKPPPLESGSFRSITNLIRNLTSALENSISEV